MQFVSIAIFVIFMSNFEAAVIFGDNDSISSIPRTENKNNDKNTLNWFLIYPGTKWCGYGNISGNNEDLGKFVETDKCCRSHDFCSDFIEGFKKKHDLINMVFYTRLNCQCDNEFYHCLKGDDTHTSRQVGTTYFTLLGTQCFRKDYPIKRCVKHQILPKLKCIQYEYDTNKEQLYQWFDLPDF